MWEYLQFQYRRRLNHFKRDAILLKRLTIDFTYKYIHGKWVQFGIVRRFLAVWWILIAIIAVGLLQQISHLPSRQVFRPDTTTELSEGLVGKVKLINPILPDNSASADLAALIFNGLVRYNAQAQPESALAQSWKVSADQKTYTFKLRPDLKWHDGQEVTAEDVLFTLALIKNPDTRSPLAIAWRDVTAKSIDKLTLEYYLPSPDPSFLSLLQVGILPKHLLASVAPTNLRTAEFNQNPIGTGPFKIRTFTADDDFIQLDANPTYHDGQPYLKGITLRFYDSYDEAVEAYAKHQIMSLNVQPEQLEDIAKITDTKIYRAKTFQQTYLFFNNTKSSLKEKSIRQALTASIKRSEIIDQNLRGQATGAPLPLLSGQLGYNFNARAASYDPKKAAELLDEAGWKLEKGIRRKGTETLEFTLVTRDSGNYPGIAVTVQKQWQQLGIRLNVKLVDNATLQQSYIKPRNFDILLYGLNLGTDSDTYPYWHSSQSKDPGLNLSQYESTAADQLLATARVSTDNEAKAAKYSNFLKIWAQDQPAAGIYNPYYIYVAQDRLKGVDISTLASPSDRFSGIHRWYLSNK